MPIIPRTGRKDPSSRLLIGAIYLVLILGAVTMVYPFLLMASGSTTSAVDERGFRLVPGFLRDDLALYRKHVEGLFNESVETMNSVYDTAWRSFDQVEFPPEEDPALVQAWTLFLEAECLPPSWWAAGYLQARYSKTTPSLLRSFKTELQEEFPTIQEANRALGTDYPGWNDFFVNPEFYVTRSMAPVEDPLRSRLWTFKRQAGSGQTYAFSLEGFFRRSFLQNLYGRDIEEYNRAHGTAWDDYRQVPLHKRFPADAGGAERDDWEIFVRETLNPQFIRVDQASAEGWRDYLRARYGQLRHLNRSYASSFSSWSQVPLPETPPPEGALSTDWSAMLQGWTDPDDGRRHRFPAEHLELQGPTFAWRTYLVERYGDISAVNAALGTRYAAAEEVAMPQAALHAAYFLEHRAPLRREFVTRNYRAVLDYLVFHGRGIVNTVIYCALAVLFALLVNPLAAYAMSRYQMPTTYKILLFLLLTMAFPPMVTQIPSFLMLREMNLLNTFAALILPGLAHGYSIFLLKGFFDSLPRDLYESAQIDGASEWTMFWQITMSLSKPILAVIALQAFTLAYSNFMFALLICQDEKMWTLMVWLYELQQKSGQGVIYASLVIAAIPTFLIFAVCQNIILRGIVVPVEK